MFRVYFWERSDDGEPGEPVSRASDEYELTETDAHEALTWADESAGSDFTYAMYLVLNDSVRGLGMVKLAGQDPNNPHELQTPWMVERPHRLLPIRSEVARLAQPSDPHR